MDGRRRRRRAAAMTGAIAYGWWATALEPFSHEATLAVLAAGLSAIALGRASRRPLPAPATPPPIAARWAVLAGALGAWQVAAYLQHPRSEHPTLSSLMNVAFDAKPLRVLGFAAWLVGAWWLARRR